MEEAPDLVVGYQRGYRSEWGSVAGRISESVFHTNDLAWQADHAFDPTLVPGVLLCNTPLEKQTPHLVDLAPTLLDAFGVDTPENMDGSTLLKRNKVST